MPIEKEEFMAFPEEIKRCLKACKVKNVVFKTGFTGELLKKPISEFLPEIVTELTDNCMEKGARYVSITLTNTLLRVEDDVIEENPEKTLKLLNKIIESGKCITTKDGQKFGGELKYSVKDGKIVAEANWK